MNKQYGYFNIVKERPDHDYHGQCPKCGSENIADHGTRTTLVGYTGSVNPNHQWTYCTCNECKLEYIHEQAGGFHWATDQATGRYVLASVPGCFESYVYTCSECDGEVTRKNFDLDGNVARAGATAALMMKNDNGEWEQRWIRQYVTKFVCSECGAETETEAEYYHGRDYEPSGIKPFKVTDEMQAEAMRLFEADAAS